MKQSETDQSNHQKFKRTENSIYKMLKQKG
jgi:hypothetical protein